MKVLKQGDIYAPEHLGRKDILIEGSRIARIADHIDEYDQIEEVEKVDLGGHILTPGYMDIHVHITGGGGESCQEINLIKITCNCSYGFNRQIIIFNERIVS